MFKIPQQTEYEDFIIPPFTIWFIPVPGLRKWPLAWLGVGGFLADNLLNNRHLGGIRYPLLAVDLGVALVMAFVRWRGESLQDWAPRLYRYYEIPKLRLWRPENEE